MTRAELIKEVERVAKEKIGKRFRYNPLGGFPAYKRFSKQALVCLLGLLKGEMK